MDDIEALDFEAGYDALADPDVYVLVRQGRVEATLTDAEVQALGQIVRKAQGSERQRRRRAPAKGFAAVVDRAFNSPSALADIDALELKLRAVVERLLDRQGLGDVRAEIRRLLGPEA